MPDLESGIKRFLKKVKYQQKDMPKQTDFRPELFISGPLMKVQLSSSKLGSSSMTG